MRTELRRADGAAWFVIVGADSARRAAAMDLMYAVDGDELVRRVNGFDPWLESIYARFAERAPEMLDQAARRRPVPWEQTLEAMVERADGLDWWLTGSAAAAVRGLRVVPRDIDLLVVTEQDGRTLAERLAGSLVEPLAVGGDWIADLFGRAFDGARIEWIGGFRPELDAEGPNEFGPATGARLDTVVWRGHRLRVPPLEVQIDVARARGLADRVRALEALPT